MLVFALFSSGRYCLIHVSYDAIATGWTRGPAVSSSVRSAPDTSVRNWSVLVMPARGGISQL